MSLDVYLSLDPIEVPCECEHCGHRHTRMHSEVVYDANITHNLNKMADVAGIYQHLWRPDELGIKLAKELIEPLEAGLSLLKEHPERFIPLNPPNGWGSYDAFVPWTEKYLEACRENPEASVRVSR